MINCQRESYIRQVRAIGESLIKNAESIVGTEEHLNSIYITAELNLDSAPAINISRTFLPEKYVADNAENKND